MNAILTSIYTLTPTHCGTGQAHGAVDLPIARESSTGLPILPSTSLKGVARAAFEARRPRNGEAAEAPFTRGAIVDLFGPELVGGTGTPEADRGGEGRQGREGTHDRDKKKGRQAAAGSLVFGEGHLLVFPFRGLHAPLVFGTCRLLLERLERQTRNLNLSLPAPAAELGEIIERLAEESGDTLLVAEGSARSIVLEDRIFTVEQVVPIPEVKLLGQLLAALLPEEEKSSRQRIQDSIVVLPDSVFADLVDRVTPVNARIKLTSGKTTSTYTNPENGRSEKGNLWYEETLPSDCLFWSVVQARTGLEQGSSDRSRDPVSRFQDGASALKNVQIGGNETVGQGFCWWNVMGGTL